MNYILPDEKTSSREEIRGIEEDVIHRGEKAVVDILGVLHNSSRHTKIEFTNSFIIKKKRLFKSFSYKTLRKNSF